MGRFSDDNPTHVRRNEREMIERTKARSVGGSAALYRRSDGSHYIGGMEPGAKSDTRVAAFRDGKRIP